MNLKRKRFSTNDAVSYEKEVETGLFKKTKQIKTFWGHLTFDELIMSVEEFANKLGKESIVSVQEFYYYKRDDGESMIKDCDVIVWYWG